MTQIPFVANWDDIHCFQACLSMVLQTFSPTQTLNHSQLEEVTGKRDTKTTWHTQGILYLLDQGFEVICQKDFDYQRFATLGETYLYERFGLQLGRVITKFSDIPSEITYAKQLISRINISPYNPTIQDITTFLNSGYLIICLVNLCKLNNQIGYDPHFILIYNIQNQEVYCHDPGPPAIASRKIPIEEFETAWSSPTKRDRNLIAIKYPTTLKIIRN
ncbi:cysteine peptidase family C39 domain-containing protein [Calothrix sp. NIES-3974]|uniref:cysteine peptidase family C39 domain-containing protein n=1 Tax=Calothrix sp. NIES-3974 TaxID=2005462 RepID=UPI000B5F6285|nr:cysteine peptidase family C39 domain-containing protein [Calothrix sp. NIES-3974]BAZ04899.1 hypothetical protein NIES3974_15450 [Calothrix sp. NIES-3974]